MPPDVYVVNESEPDLGRGNFRPGDKPLEELATRLADLLLAPVGPYDVHEDARRAKRARELFFDTSAPITPQSLQKVLWWMGRHKSGPRAAHLELFRVAKRSAALAQLLVANGVKVEALTYDWKFENTDAAPLFVGIALGLARGLAIVGREAIVFAVISTVLAAGLGVVLGGIFTMIFTTLFIGAKTAPAFDAVPERPGLDFGVEIKDPHEAMKGMLALLRNPVGTMREAMSAKLTEFDKAFFSGRYLAAGVMIGEALVQVVLVLITAKQLVEVAGKIAPKLKKAAGDRLAAARAAFQQGRLRGATQLGVVDGWEYYRLRNGEVLMRRGGEVFAATEAELAAGAEGAKGLSRSAVAEEVASGRTSPGRAIEPEHKNTLQSQRGLDDAGVDPTKRATVHNAAAAPPPGPPPPPTSGRVLSVDRKPIIDGSAWNAPHTYSNVKSWLPDAFMGTSPATYRRELTALLARLPKSSQFRKKLFQNGGKTAKLHSSRNSKGDTLATHRGRPGVIDAGHVQTRTPGEPDLLVVQSKYRNLGNSYVDEVFGSRASDFVLILEEGGVRIAFDPLTARELFPQLAAVAETVMIR
ncbi:MAG: hypothetical protein JNK82_13155 [Myxococcaceae bacterium]|nr:hypothetical protein [Myxococcaceae bacterium]